MAIKITVTSAEGLNVNSGNGSYLNQFPPTFDTGNGNFGYFKDSFTNSKQYGVAEDAQSGTQIYSEGAALVAGGKLSYSLTSHTLTGKLNTLSFGEGLNGVNSPPGITNSKMSLDETDLSFAALGLNSAKGDKVHDILYGMMTGDADAFLNHLAKNAVSFKGGAGDDTYIGGRKADTLAGGAGADTLSGGKGNDKLTGGLGADHLTGAGGKDVFIFKSVAQSTLDEADTISGFKGSAGDRIHLKAIDADSTAQGNNAFDFIGTDAFSGKAGELRYESAEGSTWIYGDVDGDGAADLAIMLNGSLSLRENFFVL